jgi:hypothetical protein
MTRVSKARARACLGVLTAVLLGLSQASAYAANGPTVPGDSHANDVTLPSSGGPPLDVGSSMSQDTSSDGSAASVTVTFGTSDGSSPGSGGNGNAGGTGTNPGPPPTCIPKRLRITDSVTVDGFGVVTAPASRAIVGLPTWYWTEPDTGGIIRCRRVTGTWTPCRQGIFGPDDTEPVTLWVDIWPGDYDWDFGDTHHQTDTCGPGKTPSSCSIEALGTKDTDQVHHTYDFSSPPGSDGYPVTLTTDFKVQLRDDGGHTAMLNGFTRAAHLPLETDQIQSILVPVPAP